VKIMVETFKRAVGTEWWDQATRDTLGVYGNIILASIIQGEYVVPEEAKEIAALYRNRLHKGMKLQADPTVQYILPERPRRLLLSDLKIDSPYNTYLYRGLPPGPINNPGITALNAALNPSEADWMFMVANGDGSHTFSVEWEDHVLAKERFDQVRREVRRNKKR